MSDDEIPLYPDLGPLHERIFGPPEVPQREMTAREKAGRDAELARIYAEQDIPHRPIIEPILTWWPGKKQP